MSLRTRSHLFKTQCLPHKKRDALGSPVWGAFLLARPLIIMVSFFLKTTSLDGARGLPFGAFVEGRSSLCVWRSAGRTCGHSQALLS